MVLEVAWGLARSLNCCQAVPALPSVSKMLDHQDRPALAGARICKAPVIISCDQEPCGAEAQEVHLVSGLLTALGFAADHDTPPSRD